MTDSRKTQFGLRGFTLIEMMVTVSIMILLVGGGIAAYLTFNDNQTAVAAGNRLEVLLRAAQKKARVGDKPTGCDSLQSYQLVLQAGSDIVTMQAVCANGTYDDLTETMSGAVTATSNATIGFRVLAGGVINPGVIQLQSGSRTYEVEVSSGGGITNNGFTDAQGSQDAL